MGRDVVQSQYQPIFEVVKLRGKSGKAEGRLVGRRMKELLRCPATVDQVPAL
jgi:hypothetical protein